jgi:hypothetical protein
MLYESNNSSPVVYNDPDGRAAIIPALAICTAVTIWCNNECNCCSTAGLVNCCNNCFGQFCSCLAAIPEESEKLLWNCGEAFAPGGRICPLGGNNEIW